MKIKVFCFKISSLLLIIFTSFNNITCYCSESKSVNCKIDSAFFSDMINCKIKFEESLYLKKNISKIKQ